MGGRERNTETGGTVSISRTDWLTDLPSLTVSIAECTSRNRSLTYSLACGFFLPCLLPQLTGNSTEVLPSFLNEASPPRVTLRTAEYIPMARTGVRGTVQHLTQGQVIDTRCQTPKLWIREKVWEPFAWERYSMKMQMNRFCASRYGWANDLKTKTKQTKIFPSLKAIIDPNFLFTWAQELVWTLLLSYIPEI